VGQVDLAEVLGIKGPNLSNYLNVRGPKNWTYPQVRRAFAELMAKKGDSREIILQQAMQIKQRRAQCTADAKAAAKQGKAPAEQKNKKKRGSSPPPSKKRRV
jgi:hypothetical protein